MAHCSICKHPWLDGIEQQLGQGVSLRVIAQRFDVSKSALSRHLTGHFTGHRPAPGPVRDRPWVPTAIGRLWKN